MLLHSIEKYFKLVKPKHVTIGGPEFFNQYVLKKIYLK